MGFKKTYLVYSIPWIVYHTNAAVYNYWTGLVDWTGGMTLKIIFTLSNETHMPMEWCGTLSFLCSYTVVLEQIIY